MTRKRYQKLFRSEMTKLVKGQTGAAMCIRAVATKRAADWGNGWKGKSYLEAWTLIRTAFIYPGNVPPIK